MLTIKPAELSTREHKRAEREGWSIFTYDGNKNLPTVQRLDELDILPDDEQAIIAAREMGLDVDDNGTVKGRL